MLTVSKSEMNVQFGIERFHAVLSTQTVAIIIIIIIIFIIMFSLRFVLFCDYYYRIKRNQRAVWRCNSALIVSLIWAKQQKWFNRLTKKKGKSEIAS